MSSNPSLRFEFPTWDGQRRRLCFANPIEIIVAYTLAEVRPALQRIQQAVASGYYGAGYIAYEAAPAFEPALHTQPANGQPLLWFGVFAAPLADTADPSPNQFCLSEWQPTIDQASYTRDIAAIRAAIARGETYQVNYTLRLRANFTGDDRALYTQLRAAQSANYCAYLNLGRYRILSLSPELFFHWYGDQIITRPMKGTAPRGRWSAEDHACAEWLAASEKNRAENLMIVDLLRNDIGRIAEIGSVAVPKLFSIEHYRTVHQMTSTVTARIRTGTTLEDVFTALFPCGSITGAPKIQTMRLIRALEDTPRGVYCGAIGFVTPHHEALFNVAIRTMVIDSTTGQAKYGVGGGITWDSQADDEYAEALLKARVLHEHWPTFDLLETLRLEYGRYTLLEAHIARIAASAQYFSIPLNTDHVHTALKQHAQEFDQQARRVRLLVAADGAIRVESQALATVFHTPQMVGFAHTPINAENRFLFHKTTNRAVYETHRAAQPELFDVLLWNTAGEVTEFTTGNLVAEIAGQRVTPPIHCGLLAGTLRNDLLTRGEIQERVLRRADVQQATRYWLINSVRGSVEVQLVEET